MHEYDEAVLNCFLENQLQLVPEKVAENIDEAEAFLEECMAVVVDSLDEVWNYFDEQGIDLEGHGILNAAINCCIYYLYFRILTLNDKSGYTDSLY